MCLFCWSHIVHHKTCCCVMLLHYFEITMRSKQARVNIESWSEWDLSCYTALLTLKKTAKLSKRQLWLSLKKSCLAEVPTETQLHWLVTLCLKTQPEITNRYNACYSMPENLAENSKYHCNASIVTTIKSGNVLITSSAHVSNIEGIYQLPGHV